jgi:hypothetical protein
METIHQSIYDACYSPEIKDGNGAMLVVTYLDKGGVAMRGKLAEKWARIIKESIDQIEADDVCEALYLSG